MASYYHNFAHQQQHHPAAPTPSAVSHSHHGGRNRRGAPRPPMSSQTSHKQFRTLRKELTEPAAPVSSFRQKFELVRSFDLEDDFEFCPSLLTESDMLSVRDGSSSERSSLASNSPTSSPTQLPQQVTPSFALNSTSPAFLPSGYQSQQSALKLHQPAATRNRNAIPIINPATGISMSSPSPSASPGLRMQQSLGRRW